MAIITKLKKEDFERILDNYKIGRYKSHKHIDWALSNTVYRLKTTKGQFILKVFENSDPKFINYQIKIIDYLYENKIPVARISKLKKGEEILMFGKKRILVQRFRKGDIKKRINDELLKDIARKFGLMSKALLKLKLKERYVWEMNHQFKPYNRKIGIIKGFDFREHEKNILNELKLLNKKKLRRSIIHGDFHGVNLLIKDNKLNAVIDFDDAHEDYIAYEIAVSMIDPFVRQNSFKRKQAKLFFKEYQKHLKLNQEEKKAVYYFIKHRILGIISYHKIQSKIHKDHKRRLIKGLNDFIAKYHAFNKMPLKDFLGLF